MEITLASTSLSSSSIPNLCPSSLSISASKSSFFINRYTRNLLTSCSTNCRISRRRSGPRHVPQRRELSCTCLFGLGVPELAVIAGVAALVFGPKQLPEIGRSIGKTVKSFQQAAKEFESELKKESEPMAEGTESKQAVVSDDAEDARISSSKEGS